MITTGRVPPSQARIGFSTLACPEISRHHIVSLAKAVGADFIEWRGGADGHVSPSMSKAKRGELRRAIEDAGLNPLSVTAYSDLVANDPVIRGPSVDDLKRHVELAADLGAGLVRAFLGRRPHDASNDTVVERAVDALRDVAMYAKGFGVGIAVENHDDFSPSFLLARVLAAVDDGAVGIVWDVANAYEAGEHPETGISQLGPWIRYVQVKDWKRRESELQPTALGDGEVPVRQALAAFGGLLPPLSVEWERAWHPELAEAAVALPQAFATIRSWLQTMGTPAT